MNGEFRAAIMPLTALVAAKNKLMRKCQTGLVRFFSLFVEVEFFASQETRKEKIFELVMLLD